MGRHKRADRRASLLARALSRAGSVPDTAVNARGRGERLSASGQMTPTRDHILLVGDDETSRYAVNRVLSSAGYDVTAATSGEQAVALARAARPALVVADAPLPDVSAVGLCRALRADAATAGIPLVFLSADRAEPQDLVGAIECGADLYLVHPVDPHVLVAALRALLRSRKAEARLRRLVEANLFGVIEFDLEGGLLDANDEFLRIVGHSRDDLAAGKLRSAELTPPEWQELDRRASEELRTTGLFRPVEKEYWRRDGSRGPVLVAGAVVPGDPNRGIGIVLDIGERKRAERDREEALARAATTQRRMSFLLSVTSALIGDPKHVVNAMRRLAGLCAGEIADWCVVDRMGPEGPERLAIVAADAERQAAVTAIAAQPPSPGGAIARALAQGTPQFLEGLADPAELEPPRDAAHASALRTLGATAAAVFPFLAHGRVLGALTLVRAGRDAVIAPVELALGEEVAGRAAVALENARLHEDLARALRVREDTLAEVSHDLRNPLSSVTLAAVQLERAVERPELAELVRRRAATIRRAAGRMSALVNDLLDLARLDTGRLSLDVGKHAAADLLDDAVEAVSPAARGKAASIQASAAPGLVVPCDRERVHRVLANLLLNALRVTPQNGRVGVSARRVGDDAVFAVEDEGPGIPEGELRRVFDRYWRAPVADAGGIGLGLSIVKAIVERHGGKVWAASEPGRGSTFAFSLPLASASGTPHAS